MNASPLVSLIHSRKKQAHHIATFHLPSPIYFPAILVIYGHHNMTTLQQGDIAPDFSLPSQDNTPISLHAFRGKKVILYFYPKDDTPGCTREACDFRDQLSHFATANTVILGISKDKPAKHQKFREKYQLPFTLLSDETGDVCAAYGVINKKSLFGNTFLGIERSTFLIDENGVISHIWRKVKVAGHIEAILASLSSGASV